MARVTVEDCILRIPNRFELVLMAAQRAKQIASGNPITLDRDNDKDAVVSLREIADSTIELEKLHEDTLNSFSRRSYSEPARALPAAETTEIDEAFADAAQNISSAENDASAGGLSFADENITPED